MDKWKISFFSIFLVIGLFSSHYILKPQKPKPAILADVTNWATIVSPTPTLTPTVGPSPTPTPTTTPSPTATPTPTITVASTASPTPSPTTISRISPIPGLPPTPTPIEEPEQYFTYSLFGYTSSYANVRLEGIKLLEGTKANQDGYFEFINFKASNRNLEFCLLSIDTENLVTSPLCVPVPKAQANQKYGPYLLPPTLKLAKGDLKTGESSQVSGKTIPSASVNLNVFNQLEKPLASLVIKPVLAQQTQKPEVLKLTANSDGSFSTDLTGTTTGKKRVFAQSIFNLENTDNKTPKSVTLTLNVFDALMAILIQLLYLFGKLLNLNFILLLQLGLVIFLLIRRKQLFSWYYLYHHKKTAIVLYRKQAITKTVKNYCPLN